MSDNTAGVTPAPAATSVPVAAQVPSAVVATTQTSGSPSTVAAKAQGLPKVQPFQLSITELAQIADSSGLQWVNSDAAKIAAVQVAIAAEPKPVHVPRERAPLVVADEGPLVLVETRRDLSDMKLPFESSAS